MDALEIQVVPVSEHCIGSKWEVADHAQLAKLIAIVAMGQAAQAAHIIEVLAPATPAFTLQQLCDEAIVKLTVEEPPSAPRKGYPRWQRDGFIFEVISWVAARQGADKDTVLKDPHVSSTSQGIDGLQLRLHPESREILQATIFEDKCTDDPRGTFLQKVLPAFKDRHEHRRSAELVACAAELIQKAGGNLANSAVASAKVTDIALRSYRSAFSISDEFDSEDRRKHLFARYEELQGIDPSQRIAACFVTGKEMRPWFASIAADAVEYLDQLKKDASSV